MKIGKQKKHVIDFIFPISLFFVFAVSSLVVILLAAGLYRSVTRESIDQDTTQTVLSYITEKIHRGDVLGGVSIETLEEENCLVIKEQIEDTWYLTYIYEDQGILKELYLKEGVEPSKQAGKEIMKVHSFQAEAITDTLFRFTVTTKEGSQDSVTVGIQSRKTASKGESYETISGT